MSTLLIISLIGIAFYCGLFAGIILIGYLIKRKIENGVENPEL